MGRPDEAALKPELLWRPNPGPQTHYIQGQALWGIIYGGAAGGGKTAGSLGDFIYHWQQHGQHVYGGFFRRRLTDLEYCIAEAKRLYGPIGARWHEQKKMFVFPNGAVLRFRQLETWDDVLSMMSTQFTRIYFEELTHWPDDTAFRAMRARLRSPHGIPTSWRATCNPGGPGHLWVKAYAIDPAPGGYELLTDGSRQYAFIPAKVADNPYLGEDYVENLKTMGSESLVAKYLDGDWTIIEGAFFDNWAARRHVCRPMALPNHWMRFRSMDWGSARPFSVGWWAVADEDTELPNGMTLCRGGLVRYREWYGCTGKPNEGLKLTVEQVAAGILQRGPEDVSYTIADPATFARDGGPSIAERMALAGVPLRRADNARVARRGALGGWDQLRQRLEGESENRLMLACFSTCADSIRTIPALQHDANNPEDLDTSAEDHAADEWRYAVMSRPWVKAKPVVYNAIEQQKKPVTFDQAITWQERGTRRERI